MSTKTLSEIQRQRIDGCVITGFEVRDGLLFTKIDDTVAIQMAYTYTKPIAERRSIDGDSQNILSIITTSDVLTRLNEWKDENGLVQVPDDFILDSRTISLMLHMNGNDASTEIAVPPLDEKGAERLREEMQEMGIEVEGGVGREPLRVVGEPLTRFRNMA